jgi:hypothetical protein
MVRRTVTNAADITGMGKDLVTMKNLLTSLVQKSVDGEPVDVSMAQSFLEKRYHVNFKKTHRALGGGQNLDGYRGGLELGMTSP